MAGRRATRGAKCCGALSVRRNSMQILPVLNHMVVINDDLVELIRARGHMLQNLKLDECTSFSTNGLRLVVCCCRDGVSESQFGQVLNVELNQIIKAYQSMGQGDLPKFRVIIAQKNHHTKLFQADSPDNVPPGTVVDSGIVHPRQYDFYMCAHAGPIGTSRPTHYHVLLDEIGFSADKLQKLVLCFHMCIRGAPFKHPETVYHQIMFYADLVQVASHPSGGSPIGGLLMMGA